MSKEKGKLDYHKAGKDKKNEKFDQRRKGFKPSNFRNQQKQPSQAVSKPARVMGEKTIYPQQKIDPLQFWICVEPNMCRNCPLDDGNVRPAYNIQEAKIVG